MTGIWLIVYVLQSMTAVWHEFQEGDARGFTYIPFLDHGKFKYLQDKLIYDLQNEKLNEYSMRMNK